MKKHRIVLGTSALVVLAALILLFSCADMKQGMVVTPPFTIAGAKYVGMEACAGCHETIAYEHFESFKKTLHARYTVSLKDGTQVLGCEACHGPASLHVEAGGGRGKFIINPRDNPAICYQCHLEKKAQFNLQFHHPLREGHMSCSSCHNLHGENIMLPPGVRLGRQNELCFQCHKEQARPFVYEHEALREGCTTCHQPHGSINRKLLIARDVNLCLRCHAQVAAPKTIVMGQTSHATVVGGIGSGFVSQGTCWSSGCHTAPHGSNINAHLRY